MGASARRSTAVKIRLKLDALDGLLDGVIGMPPEAVDLLPGFSEYDTEKMRAALNTPGGRDELVTLLRYCYRLTPGTRRDLVRRMREPPPMIIYHAEDEPDEPEWPV